MARIARQYAEDWLEGSIRYNERVAQDGDGYLELLQKYNGKKQHCENCGRETEYLFDGFASAKNARAKFILGEQVKVSAEGRARGFRTNRKTILMAFSREETIIKIRREGNQQGEYYHMDFWEPVKKRDTSAIAALSAPFQTEPAKVCQRCRPLSNLEIEEILNGR